MATRASRDIQVIDEANGLIRAHGKEIIFLREARNPKDIPWRDTGVSLVVDCTGKFRDPHTDADDPKGRSARPPGRRRAHGGAELPVQEQAEGRPLPDDAFMLINGINHHDYDPGKHKLVSAASCTTTALAHMMRPLLDRDLTRNMITAGMSTVHAVTNSQPVLDAVPGAGDKDMRKTRGAMGNIVSPPPTPPKLWSRSCPRSPASASWPTRCASPPRASA